MSARVLLDACLIEPFLERKLMPDAPLPPAAERAVRSSLAALAAAARPS
jgi:hypothetical protein